jgi:hypothetical protein
LNCAAVSFGQVIRTPTRPMTCANAGRPGRLGGGCCWTFTGRKGLRVRHARLLPSAQAPSQTRRASGSGSWSPRAVHTARGDHRLRRCPYQGPVPSIEGIAADIRMAAAHAICGHSGRRGGPRSRGHRTTSTLGQGARRADLG